MDSPLPLLRQIHRAHAYGWSFENLDVFLSGRNGLDKDSLTAKLGPKTRGGWCFELNEWLALALEGADFKVRRLMARSVFAPDRPRTHQISLVQIGDEVWTADAGFGAQTPRGPMKLEDGFEDNPDGLGYRMEHRPAVGPAPFGEPDHWVLSMRWEGGWKALYRFTLESATAADFATGNHYHLTSPGSSFADSRIATKPIPGGRITLADHTLKHWRNTPAGEVLDDQQTLEAKTRYADVLFQRFGLGLEERAVDRLWSLEPSVSRGNPPL